MVVPEWRGVGTGACSGYFVSPTVDAAYYVHRATDNSAVVITVGESTEQICLRPHHQQYVGESTVVKNTDIHVLGSVDQC